MNKFFIIIAIFAIFVCFAQSYVIDEPPPRPDEAAKMARYIMRNTVWVSVATISTQKNIKNYPFVSLKSVSDGTESNSTGIPYLYLTDIDVSGADLKVNSKCTIMASLAESDYCNQKNFDPQDPRCAKLMISGNVIKLTPNEPEYQFGKEALFFKHPSMKWWPATHHFYVAKIDIQQIAILDFFGGIKYVTLQDYFNADTIIIDKNDLLFRDVFVLNVKA